MVTRSARVRGRSAKSEVGVVSAAGVEARRRFRRAWRVRHVPVVSCVRERWDQLQCACVGVCLSRARGHRRIEIHIIHRRDMTKVGYKKQKWVTFGLLVQERSGERLYKTFPAVASSVHRGWCGSVN